MTNKLKNLLLSIVPVVITGAVCSYFSRTGVEGWFATMRENSYMPPNYVFSTAWSVIYICLMISFYRILSSTYPDKTLAVRLYWQQLILQILWCIVFFGMQMPLIGGLIILWLIIAVFRMIRAFLKISTFAGSLNYFYFLYICFAAFLNWAFLYGNSLIKTF